MFIGAGIDWPAIKSTLDACLIPEATAENLPDYADLEDPFPLWRRAEHAA